jgi:hypothetical protein
MRHPGKSAVLGPRKVLPKQLVLEMVFWNLRDNLVSDLLKLAYSMGPLVFGGQKPIISKVLETVPNLIFLETFFRTPEQRISRNASCQLPIPSPFPKNLDR